MYDTQWKCDINKNVLKIILLMKEHNKKQSMWMSVSCYGSTSPSPSPGDFCVGLGVQASKETARKLKFNELLSLSLLDLYWDLLYLARGH